MHKVIICIVSTLLLSAVAVEVILAQKVMRTVIGADGVLPEEPYRTKWALLIGINKYPNLTAAYQLNYAENDVNEMKKVLMEQYQYLESNIITLINEQATYQGIRDKFIQLSDRNKIGINDCVLIYFSGHGRTVYKPRGGDLGFLLPYDAKVDMDNVNDISSYYGTCMGMDELKRLAGRIPAKHIIFLVDACYSGLAVASRGGFQTSIPGYLSRTGYLRKVASVPVQQIITAGIKDDVSSESPEWGHGAFTYKLLEALRTGVVGENDDGITTGLELAAYLRNVVPNISPKQTPQYGYFDGEGEFLFLKVDKPVPPIKPDTTIPRNDLTQPAVDNQPANILKEIISKDGAKMVLIPAGEFQMGDALDGVGDAVHIVYLDAFYMDVYEVTNAQYKKFMDATGYKAPTYWNDTRFNQPNYPVICLWNDAVAYADWAGKRLPTEAEWEKAARGGLVGKEYSCGDTINHDYANYEGTGGKDLWENTSPVGSFAPNGYGLYDMAGNVWEWCEDWYDRNYYAVSLRSNPIGPSSGKQKVLRGGSWSYIGHGILDLRVARRGRSNPSGDYNDDGFRCVQDVPK
jgi:sulfatase modifying factor 1